MQQRTEAVGGKRAGDAWVDRDDRRRPVASAEHGDLPEQLTGPSHGEEQHLAVRERHQRFDAARRQKKDMGRRVTLAKQDVPRTEPPLRARRDEQLPGPFRDIHDHMMRPGGLAWNWNAF